MALRDTGLISDNHIKKHSQPKTLIARLINILPGHPTDYEATQLKLIESQFIVSEAVTIRVHLRFLTPDVFTCKQSKSMLSIITKELHR